MKINSIHLAAAFGFALITTVSIIVMSPDTTAMGAGEASFKWRTINEALDEAPEAKKLILLDVYTDWCGWCKRMDRDSYADSSVGAFISERFVPAKMNPEKEGTVKFDGKDFTQAEFGRALGITGYPATAFFTADRELITVVSGYYPPKDFHLLLRFLADEHYKTVSFEDSKKANS